MKKEILKDAYTSFGQKVGAAFHAPSQGHIQFMLFALGVTLLSVGMTAGIEAQPLGAANAGGRIHSIEYNDIRLGQSINAILTYIEGTFGAMVMVAAGLGAILSSAFGQYRAALGLLVVAVGAFILRSLVGTFFNDDNVQG